MNEDAKKISPEKAKVITSLIVSGIFILLLWGILFFEKYTHSDLSEFGVYPRTLSGLKGIFFSPLLHAGYEHLFSNSISLFLLTFGVFYLYRNSAIIVFAVIYFLPQVIVWFIGRSAYHIGASSMVYGFAAYLFFMGLFRKDKGSIAFALLVVFLYGSLVWGLLPVDQSISFESHIAGAFLGILCSVIFRNSEPVKKYEWEEEEEEFKEENSSEDALIDGGADEVYFNEDETYDEELENILRKNKISGKKKE
jgi:membrane associated rhomboid family serine protease